MLAGWSRPALCAVALWVAAGCRSQQAEEKGRPMMADPSLDSVRDDQIQFATMRPRGSKSAVLDRRVRVIAPPDAVLVAESGDTNCLPGLIALLHERGRSWAAEVMLSAMTGREGKIVESSQAATWSDTVGRTAHERWSSWLDRARDRLVWDADERVFVER